MHGISHQKPVPRETKNKRGGHGHDELANRGRSYRNCYGSCTALQVKIKNKIM